MTTNAHNNSDSRANYRSEDEATRLALMVFSEDSQVRRESFMETLPLPQNVSDPDFCRDCIEVQVKLTEPWNSPDFCCIQLGDYWCEAETCFELEFLVVLSEATKRGMPFEDAWKRALEILKNFENFSDLVYELRPEDNWEIFYWIDRIAAQGVDKVKASAMATEITAILKQILLTKSDDWYVESDYELSEDDVEMRESLLKKLAATAD